MQTAANSAGGNMAQEEKLLNYHETLHTNERFGNPRDAGVCCNNIAMIYTEQKNFPKAH